MADVINNAILFFDLSDGRKTGTHLGENVLYFNKNIIDFGKISINFHFIHFIYLTPYNFGPFNFL